MNTADIKACLNQTGVRAVLQRLGVERVESYGPENWLCSAPYREDRHPSLSIQRDSGLWNDKASGEGGDLFDLVMMTTGASLTDAEALVCQSAGISPNGQRPTAKPAMQRAWDNMPPEKRPARTPVVATYPYTDKHGQLLFSVHRKADKSFFVNHPGGAGGTASGYGGQRVLYHLPEIVNAGEAWVLLCEGEKDADRARALGFIATTSPGGAKAWRSGAHAYESSLRGKRVAILPDNDQPGWEYAQQAARSLHRNLGGPIARELKIIELPGLGERVLKHGLDLSDWLDQAHPADELKALIDAAPAWEPGRSDDTPVPDSSHPAGVIPSEVRSNANSPSVDAESFFSNASIGGFRTLTLGELASVDVPPITWVVDGLLAAGSLNLLAGRPKGGKTLLALDCAASIAVGEPFLGLAVEQGPVLIYQAEDLFALTRDRLYVRIPDHRADVPLHLIPLLIPEDEPLRLDRAESFRRLKETVERLKPRLLILDPLREIHQQNENESDYMAPLLRPLRQLAHDTNTAIWLVHHANWAGRSRGSTAIPGGVDNVYEFDSPGDDDSLEADRVCTLSGEGRFHPKHRRLAVRLRPGLRWERTSEGYRDDLSGEERVLRHLEHTGRWFTPQDLTADLGVPAATVQRALATLIGKHKVRRYGPGVRGRPYTYAVATITDEKKREETEPASTLGKQSMLLTSNGITTGEWEASTEPPSGQQFCTVCRHLLGNAEDRARGVHAQCEEQS